MGKHAVKPKDYITDRGYAISAGCGQGGDGQCDGAIYDRHDRATAECRCECHSEHASLKFVAARTVAEMEAAHADKYRIRMTRTPNLPHAHRKP